VPLFLPPVQKHPDHESDGKSYGNQPKRLHAAARESLAVYPGALPGDDPPAAEEAKAVAADAGSIKPATGSPPRAAFAASSFPSRTIPIVIRVAPDNLKLEVAKSAIASVTTQDALQTPSGLLRPSGLSPFGLEKRDDEEESQKQNCPDCCGAADLSLRHLRIPSGVSGKALLSAISKRIHLGLDLQGGAHLILQVVVSEAVSAETDNTVQVIQQDLKKANLTFSAGVQARSEQAGGDSHRGNVAGQSTLCAHCWTPSIPTSTT
jgi:hypothetical protein